MSEENQYTIDSTALLTKALTLTAALAWNEAVKSGIQSLYPKSSQSSFQATALYAVVVTIIVIIVFNIMREITKIVNRNNKNNKKQEDTCITEQNVRSILNSKKPAAKMS